MLDIRDKIIRMHKTTFAESLLMVFQITFLLAIHSCGHVDNNESKAKNMDKKGLAKQIEISDLKSYLERLQNGQLEYDFFGITSNGIDCIYFVPDGNEYAIEFEVMMEDQKPWLDRLIAFAQRNNFRSVITTYNNEPDYESNESAPVLRIETKSNVAQTATIGQNIMTKVFRNDHRTVYEVVP